MLALKLEFSVFLSAVGLGLALLFLVGGRNR